jgi:hypothetical protein
MKRWAIIFGLTVVSILAVLLVVGCATETARAQEGGVVRFYFLPVDNSVENYRGPEYLKWRWNPTGLDVVWSCKDFGEIDNIMVCAADVTTIQHTFLSTQTDVFTFPVDLDTNPSPQQLSDMESYLENALIPANWLSPGDSWRDALRTVTGMGMWMQRYSGITGGVTLQEQGVGYNTQFRNLDAQIQSDIREAFTSLGMDDSFITGTMTVRNIAKNAADQWGETPVIFGALVTL